ncbi:MAG: hypothetical protein EXR36_02225 [Betaproteobacteria bacterium]|nr:hypothetical protein [Betaproteobacteria bacterium]
MPALRRLLSRANRTRLEARDKEAALCALFDESLKANPPCAALTALADGLGPSDNYWLRADPIHLQPMRDDLAAMEIADLAPEEAQALIQSINALLADDGLQLIYGAPNRWYFRLLAQPRITTTALSQVIGRGIDVHLPKGDEAPAWQRRLTEIQMLLHTHAINEKREWRLAVSALWLWGGGSLPTVAHKSFSALYGVDALATGLARWSGAESFPLPGRFELPLNMDNSLVILAPSTDFFSGLDQSWFAPLLASLRRRSIAQCDIVVWNGATSRYRLSPRDLWRFWRKDSSHDLIAADA